MAKAVTIRNVPDDVCEELAARAARGGRSLQEYLRARLIELAAAPDMDAVMARVRVRKQATGSRLPMEIIVDHRNAERR